MVKFNSRDMRVLRRELLKTKNELVKTKQNLAKMKKNTIWSRTEDAQTLERENKILLQSLKNFNAACNKQHMTIRKQNRGIRMLQKDSRELTLLKSGLKSIRHARNPHLIRKANI